MFESLSPIDIALIKKIGGNGQAYTLPVASSAALGGVQPADKTDAMTQAVGVDADGALWTESGGGGDEWELIQSFTAEENVYSIKFSLNTEIYVDFLVKANAQAWDVSTEEITTSATIGGAIVQTTNGNSISSQNIRGILYGGVNRAMYFFVILKKYADGYIPFALSPNGNPIVNGSIVVPNVINGALTDAEKTPDGVKISAWPSTGKYEFAAGATFELWGLKK